MIKPTEIQIKFIFENYNTLSQSKIAKQLNLKHSWVGSFLLKNGLKKSIPLKVQKEEKRLLEIKNRNLIAKVLEEYSNNPNKSIVSIGRRNGVNYNTVSTWLTKHYFPLIPNETTVIITLKSKL